MKTSFYLLILFLGVTIGGYLWSTHATTAVPSVPSAVNGTTQTTTSPKAESSAASSTNEMQAPVPGAKPGASSYTLAQVATHNTASSCWAAISGNVYNLTSWISQHPGGQARILSICGKDGTQAFSGQHGNDPRALSILAGFKIGTLAS